MPANHSFIEAVERIVTLINEKNFTIFSRFDHSAGAKKQGLEFKPVELIIFGNPNIGTLLMQDQQSCGIDLPVKILVWEDESNKVWLSYNTMSSLKTKHQLTEKSNSILQRIEEIVADICQNASGS